jgi:uncharacterized cupin superfamily protein
MIDETAWSADDETPGQVAMLVQSSDLQAGLWRTGGATWDPFSVHLERSETIYVLTGTGQLQVNDSPPVQLLPGVTTTIPAGSDTLWTVDENFTEVWIYH